MELEKRGVAYSGSPLTGLEFRRPDGGLAFFRHGILSCNTRGANNICLNKEATKAFLRAKGLPVARSEMFSTQEEEDAVRYAAFLGYPVVLKRLAGMGGSGVWPNIQNETEFKAIWAAHLESRYRYMVEKHVFGDDYRFLVADGAVIAVLNRQPPSIIGDGVKPIAELVAARNTLRMSTNNVVHKRIPVDESLQVLEQQGFSRSYVPANGERILLRPTANISSGGDGIDRTEVTPVSYKELAIACVKAVPELRVGGVDIIIRDFDSGSIENNCTILEINHNPMLSMHHFPWIGKPRDVAKTVVGILLGTDRAEMQVP
jgi:D-alanine-D-alanine ligase-like ATP-grasp enzyme